MDSDLNVDISLQGGTKEDPRTPTVTVSVSNPMAVKMATVTVDIYDGNGELVKSGVLLNDNGVKPDARANDGIYSASLGGILQQAGEYEIVAQVTNPDGKAVYGSVVAGADESTLANTPIKEQFRRARNVYFDYVPSGVTTNNDTGGCSIASVPPGPFDPTLPLLLFGAGLCLLVRSRRGEYCRIR